MILALLGCKEDPRPDVFLLIFDTTRFDVIEGFGDPQRDTSPAIEDFLDGCVRYTGDISAAPWTAPAIGSILTGVEPGVHGTGVRQGRPAGRMTRDERRALAFSDMSPSATTLAQVLSDAGWESRAWSANSWFGNRTGFPRGYQSFEIDRKSTRLNSSHRT